MTGPAGLQRIDLGTDELILEQEGPLAWLTFNRPQARNAMTWAMYQGLYDTCEWVDAQESVRLLILKGAGDRAFVSGTDISQFVSFSTPEDALAYERNSNRYIGRLESLQKPSLAMLRGYCAGGGAAIAMACDLRLAAEDVKFGFPIARTLGNTLSVVNLARLVSLVGPGRAKELLFTARFVEAEEGRAWGLFNEVIPPADLQDRARALAAQIASNAPLTLRALKEGIRRVLVKARIDEAADLILLCYMSADFKEGVQAFLDKRPPQWLGK